MKKALICLTVLTLAACSDYANWDKRGPDASGAEPQKSLVLPPDFSCARPLKTRPLPPPKRPKKRRNPCDFAVTRAVAGKLSR